jgi:phenylalanyl-tRNA synthetase beta chain
VAIPEDIVEEVARIYGYQNLPSEIMKGKLPMPITDSPFKFENKIREILKSHGGNEIYSNSLVPREFVENKNALSLKNPLGDDAKYLRTSLQLSLNAAVLENKSEKDPFYLFEVANVYIPTKNNLPNEVMMLGVVFANYDYLKAKGIVESLYDELNITDSKEFNLNMQNNILYFEIEIEILKKQAKEFKTYKPISKYPAQIEDITLSFPKETRIGDVLKIFEKGELVDNFKNYFTFRVWYHNDKKTLTDKEVAVIREKYLKEIREKFGGSIKS